MTEITREEFEKLYNSKTNAEFCKEFNCSAMTLNRRLNELGIKKKGKGNTRKLVINKKGIL